MFCVYFCFFGWRSLITPSFKSDYSVWYIWLAYTNLKKYSNSVISSNTQTNDPFSIVSRSSVCVFIFLQSRCVPIQPDKRLCVDL